MPTRLLKKGDTIKIKVATIFGWKGFGTVVEDQLSRDNRVIVYSENDTENERCIAMRHEVQLIKS